MAVAVWLQSCRQLLLRLFIMMFRKGGVEKRLKKISKQEAASLKLLEKQEVELVKAVEENEKLVETILTKETPAEVKIRTEIDKLTGKLRQLNCDLEKVRILSNKTLGIPCKKIGQSWSHYPPHSSQNLKMLTK